MDRNWRDQVRRLSDTVPERTKTLGNQIRESAPEVSQRIRQQIDSATPVVSHRVHEVRKSLRSPVPQQLGAASALQPTAQPALVPQPVLSMPPSRTDIGNTQVAVRQAIRPTAVHVAFVSLFGAAIASAVLAGVGVVGLMTLRDSVDKVLHLDPTGTASFYANDYVDEAETTLMAAAVGLGIVFAIAYMLVGMAVRRGNGWPRPVGTVLAILSLPILFLGPVAIVIVVAGIIAVLSLWIPSARRYCVESKAAKRCR